MDVESIPANVNASLKRAAPTTVVLRELSVEVDREKGLPNRVKKLLKGNRAEKETKDVEMVGNGSSAEGENGAKATAEDSNGIIISAPKEEKDSKEPSVLRLIKSVNAVIPPGKVTAIMGSSGAGKTTLLNTIASRLSGSARPVGSIYFNGVDVVPLRKKGRGKRTAYVKQEDALLPYLTVRETLRYNAELRLPASMPTSAKHAQVEEIILELNLKECANTVIGTASSTASSSRGCSSGERRLVSIAIQLLSSPSLLLLDEPTSSLDSFTSFSVCQTLKSIAQDQGRTIIMSVHQPRYSSFELFDHLILLCKGGHLVYSGPAKDVKSYFENLLDVQMSTEQNPADWILDLSSVDYSSERAEAESKKRLEFLAAAWREKAESEVSAFDPATLPQDPVEPDSLGLSGSFTRFWLEVNTMTRRGYNNLWRDRGSLFGVFAETILFSIVMGGIFWKLPNDLASIRSRQTLFVMVGWNVFDFWCFLWLLTELSLVASFAPLFGDLAPFWWLSLVARFARATCRP